MRLFESHVPARLPKALSPDPAIDLKERSQDTSPHLPDSRSLPAVFMAHYLPWRRASTKRRSTNAL